MQAPDFASSRSHSGLDAAQPYSMHVSARYLELTKKKLELTRLPRELPTNVSLWTYGTPKSVLEPLLDYWLEQYDWRAQEASLNYRLPQFRCSLEPADANTNDNDARTTSTTPHEQRVHFVHKRCQATNAIPLLFCHGWPGSFLEASKVIDGLSEPYFAATPPGAKPPLGFHVVVPSIPGFGFSDAPAQAEFGLEQTADCFNKLMGQLGYDKYVAHGSGFGFAACRMLSLRHPENCMAIHAISPQLPVPQLRQSYSTALRYKIAKLTNARYEALAFGYTPNEILSSSRPQSPSVSGRSTPPDDVYAIRPHTRAFSLTDSPAALLGTLLDLLRPQTLDIPPKPPPPQQRSRKPASTSSSRSSSMDNVRRTAADPFMEPIRESIESGLSLLQLSRPAAPSWTPDDVLNWTMMIWLPGPEGGLRWLNQVARESEADPDTLLWSTYSSTPLGISTFRESDNGARNPDHSFAPDDFAQQTTLAQSRRLSPTSWWQKLWSGSKWGSKTSVPSRATAATTDISRLGSPPSWASAYQRLEWVRRHDTQVRMPVWEQPDQVVVDIRDCFGDLQERGLLQIVGTATNST